MSAQTNPTNEQIDKAMHAAALARLEALGGRVQEGFDGCFLEVTQ